MKVNILYKCKSCGQVFIGKTVNYKSDNVKLTSAIYGQPQTKVHECEEDVRSGIAELFSAEKADK